VVRSSRPRSCLLVLLVLLAPIVLTSCGRSEEPDSRARSAASSAIPCADVEATRQVLRSACDYFMERPLGSDAIFVGGYACRTLVAGHAIFQEPRYLAAAVEWADWLLSRQDSTGYWVTGYSKHYYLADTASALALFFVLHPHVGTDRRARYLDAVTRHVEAIQRDGLVLPSGAIGAGWRFDEQLSTHVPYPDAYTIASALSGAEVFTWMYVQTGDRRHLDVAYRALSWILDTMRDDGVVPYVLAREGGRLDVAGDEANDRVLWEEWRYDTAGYVGEGVIAFLAHCDRSEMRRAIEKRIRPLVEMLVHTQNADGTWAVPGSADQKRSPGVVNLLAWYHARVEPDDRVRDAICRFAGALRDPHLGQTLGLQNAGAPPSHPNAIVTALTGRALASIVVPDVDVRW
jgi:hypothetical protein